MQPYNPPPPPMYPQPQPPSGGGPNVGLIVGLVVGIFVVLPISILVCAGFVGYFRAKSAARAATYSTTYATSTAGTATAAPSLSETYPSSNGLVVAHYPSDFAAKALDHATIRISRNNLDGTDEVVSVAGVENPISDDVNEFSRVLVQQLKKGIEDIGDKWIETSRRRTTCFKAYPGLEIEGTFTHLRTRETVKLCYFMRTNKGYEMKLIVPTSREATDLPVLQSIIDATDVK